MNHKIHLAIQIIPLVKRDRVYSIVDKAIEKIADSGLPYSVGPMETVIEGEYDNVLLIARKAQEACLEAGADELVVNLKIHVRKNADITWEEKMKKYS